MVTELELEKYKTTVQNIINKYFPEKERFSVKDFNQEQLWYLCELLIENDEERRKTLLGEIENKSQQADYKYESKYNEMLKTKEVIELYIRTTNDLYSLNNDIDTENKMDLELDNLDL